MFLLQCISEKHLFQNDAKWNWIVSTVDTKTQGTVRYANVLMV